MRVTDTDTVSRRPLVFADLTRAIVRRIKEEGGPLLSALISARRCEPVLSATNNKVYAIDRGKSRCQLPFVSPDHVMHKYKAAFPMGELPAPPS